MALLMPLSLTVSCFSKIQIGFTFLVLAHPGSPGQRAVKRVCVCFLLCYIIADLVTGKPIKMLMPVVPRCSSGTFEGREPVGNQLTQERWLPGKQNSVFF